PLAASLVPHVGVEWHVVWVAVVGMAPLGAGLRLQGPCCATTISLVGISPRWWVYPGSSLRGSPLVFCECSIPVPSKSQLGVSTASETGYPHHNSSPERGPRKRASSEAEAQLKYKQTPSPNNNAAAGEERHPANLTPPPPAPKHVSSSLDASMASLHLRTTAAANKEEEQREEGEQGGHTEVDEKNEDAGIESEADKQREAEEHKTSSIGASGSSAEQDVGQETVSSNHTGAMNGSLASGQVPLGLVPELHCSVEQAEEIMGTEATGLGLGLGVGLGLIDEARLEDYRCIAVDHAVAVECDEQVLGELDVAGFEEFNRRIYALNENMSSFRRPRKNSDK
ncbi:hypothetical protein XENOCAPTIV_016938, partial [Xenoophorus captivus]